MKMIVKVYVPMAIDGKRPPWSISGRGNLHATNVPEAKIPPAVRDAMGKDFKAYFEAEWLEREEKWVLGARAQRQNW